MTITDFPMDKDVPEFPHHSIILDYYKKYAKHYDLLKHVKNNIYVTKTYKKNNATRALAHITNIFAHAAKYLNQGLAISMPSHLTSL